MHADFIAKGYSIRKIEANNTHVTVLFNDFSIEVLNANDINQVIARREKGPLGDNADMVDITVVHERSEIWCCDNKGFVHILDCVSLDLIPNRKIKTEYENPGNCVGSSADGKYVAVGDTKGTVTLFDTDSRSKKWYVKAHKNKSMIIKFTSDS